MDNNQPTPTTDITDNEQNNKSTSASSSTIMQEDYIDDLKSVMSSVADDSASNLEAPRTRNAAQSEEAKLLATSKNNRIVCLRVVFAVGWLISASLISYAVYWFVSNDQQEEFGTSFDTQATKILDRFFDIMESNLVTLGSLSTTITSFAMSTGATFPNVTLDDFYLRAANTRILLDAGTVFYAPLVEEVDRLGFEEYTSSYISENYEKNLLLETKARFSQDYQFGYPIPDAFKPKQEQQEVNGDEGDSGVRALQADEGEEGIFVCMICGENGGNDVLNPDSVATVPTQPERTCGEYVTIATNGGIPQEQCFLLQGLLQTQCGCPEAPPLDDEGGNTDETSSSEQRKFPEHYSEKISVPINEVSTPLPPGFGPYLPLWQMSPLLPQGRALMVDMLRVPWWSEGSKVTLETGEAVTHPVTGLRAPGHNDTNTQNIANTFTQLNQFRHIAQGKVSLDDPISPISYPVFDNFESTSKVVGLILTNVAWRNFLIGILPDGIDGIMIVMENSANQTFTYRLDGPNVTYLSDQDVHDPKYNELAIVGDIDSFAKAKASPRTRAYTTVNLSSNGTSYKITVYPSQAFEDAYVDNKPVLYTVVVACAFVVSALFFLLYDFLVERRQSIVMDHAVKSGAVVNSLFPETVRDRLYEEHEIKSNNKNNSKQNNKKAGWNTSQNLETMLESGEFAMKEDPTSSTSQIYDDSERSRRAVIADEFPETTIIFADLAGFTRWSNTRQPKDVFHLLESVYGAFDKIAAKRNVFKVETIGDCYLAVTGLPKPQPDHAVRMCKFAKDCMNKMKDVTTSLSNQLGPDVMDLDFRVGLHSGPVTAGVIRGDKSRFQLFGDTVNTAARMESNGMKGRIHCSQATADQLIVAGYTKWLTPREGGIEAKGLGLLATYFVEPEIAKTNTAPSQISSYRSERDEDDPELVAVDPPMEQAPSSVLEA